MNWSNLRARMSSDSGYGKGEFTHISLFKFIDDFLRAFRRASRALSPELLLFILVQICHHLEFGLSEVPFDLLFRIESLVQSVRCLPTCR